MHDIDWPATSTTLNPKITYYQTPSLDDRMFQGIMAQALNDFWRSFCSRSSSVNHSQVTSEAIRITWRRTTVTNCN
jgi:hypothetical protein